MAFIHHTATLTPSKLDLLSGWLPGQPWFTADGPVEKLGAYRFDDPAGEVGLETFLLEAADGTVLQVPLSYRGAPLGGAEAHLVGTLEHSALGTRYVYDGCGDPVWLTEAARIMLTGGSEAAQEIEGGEVIPPATTVQGTGIPGATVPSLSPQSVTVSGQTTVVDGGPAELVVVRQVGAEILAPFTLTGSWPGGGPALLAGLTPHLPQD